MFWRDPQWVGRESMGAALVGTPLFQPSWRVWLRRNNRRLSSPLQRPSAPPISTHAGKEFAIFWDAAGTVVGGNAAGIDPNLGKS